MNDDYAPTGYELVIPASFEVDGEEYSVTTIGSENGLNASFPNDKIASVVISEGITRIEACAFYRNKSIVSVSLPNALTSIGMQAFYNCSVLTRINFPASLTDIDSYILRRCAALKQVDLSQLSIETVPIGMFEDCSGLEEVVLPETITTIDDRAFYGCAFKSIALPDAVTAIDSYAFYNCKQLETIYAMGGDEQKFQLPSSISSLGSFVFSKCSSLKITTEDLENAVNLTKIQDYTFESSGISDELILPQRFDYLGSYAFYKCTGLKKVDLSKMTDVYILNPDPELNQDDVNTQKYQIFGYSYYYASKPLTFHAPLGSTTVELCANVSSSRYIFEELLAVKNIVVTVKTPDGTDVTEQCNIDWVDHEGNYVGTGSILKPAEGAMEYLYTITLGEELLLKYHIPAQGSLVSSVNDVIQEDIVLDAIDETTFYGVVVDKLGNPLSDAKIALTQTVNGRKVELEDPSNEGQIVTGNLMDMAYAEALVNEKCKDKKGRRRNPGNGVIAGESSDPSGYVYEAVFSNRIEGATVTTYYQDETTKQAVVWDASEYDQINPMRTNSEGFYAWFVPDGYWKVVAEKEGYKTADTSVIYQQIEEVETVNGWHPVLPVQLEVHVPMESTEAPQVETALAYEDGIVVLFSQYMKEETLEIPVLVNRLIRFLSKMVRWFSTRVDTTSLHLMRKDSTVVVSTFLS